MAGSFGFPGHKVDATRFSMVPRADVPRSTFASQHTHKTTFDADWLIPFYLDEILPGDSCRLNCTGFVRMATPLFPIMDNLYLDCFFFFVPNRLVWDNWVKLQGERRSPSDSIDYYTPVCQPSAGSGYAIGSLFDYMGIPTEDQVDGGFTHISLPLRAYNLIWNEWFRDENLQNAVDVNYDSDGADDPADYQVLKRGKRHDYFTSALPWPQKGEPVRIPLGTEAPVRGIGLFDDTSQASAGTAFFETGVGAVSWTQYSQDGLPAGQLIGVRQVPSDPPGAWWPDIYADLSEATANTINELRTAFQVQKLLERDARGGTRYTEMLQAHFGVRNPDSRLQRPEYLGGGSVPINITPVAQTSATGLTGGTSPLGGLGAAAMTTLRSGFSQAFTEHGYVLGLINVRADLTYQQGLHRLWSRRTRYDFYMPAFAHLGEQAIYQQELFLTGDAEDNALVFGYQERWAEYRHKPSRVSGMFRSGLSGTLDSWHLAEEFATAPALNAAFIASQTPMARVLAAGENAVMFLGDFLFDVKLTRALPVYSVPGSIDRF